MLQRRSLASIFALLVCFAPTFAHAAPAAIQVAQTDNDDSYDPFADYSEFDQAQEEEEDINFFRNGRFVTIGLIAGYRGFTGNLSSLMTGAINYGLFLSYFFDLRFALQFSFLTGDHSFSFNAPGGPYGGDVGFQDFGINLKYYINTQNVTKGLAKFNPYIILGFSEIFRTVNVDNTSAFGKDSATGFNLGGGIEFPIMRNKMFYGAQAMYTQVSFPNSNSQLTVGPGNYPTGITPSGNTYTLLGIIGINF